MDVTTYTIKENPEGKWVLVTGSATYGPFDTLELAVAGMDRVRKPVAYHYNRDGTRIITGD